MSTPPTHTPACATVDPGWWFSGIDVERQAAIALCGVCPLAQQCLELAMAGEGRIHIAGSARPGWVMITVTDSGPGIPAGLRERIFELNFSGRRAARAGKLGFGLWWVRTMMTRLGSTISVADDAQHGASFVLRMPAASPAEQTAWL